VKVLENLLDSRGGVFLTGWREDRSDASERKKDRKKEEKEKKEKRKKENSAPSLSSPLHFTMAQKTTSKSLSILSIPSFSFNLLFFLIIFSFLLSFFLL